MPIVIDSLIYNVYFCSEFINQLNFNHHALNIKKSIVDAGFPDKEACPLRRRG
jgi:hypothetical protein